MKRNQRNQTLAKVGHSFWSIGSFLAGVPSNGAPFRDWTSSRCQLQNPNRKKTHPFLAARRVSHPVRCETHPAASAKTCVGSWPVMASVSMSTGKSFQATHRRTLPCKSKDPGPNRVFYLLKYWFCVTIPSKMRSLTCRVASQSSDVRAKAAKTDLFSARL